MVVFAFTVTRAGIGKLHRPRTLRSESVNAGARARFVFDLTWHVSVKKMAKQS
jgi:hypothetical protein